MPGIVTFALVPVVIFGFIDTMYLAQEKAYRDLHAHTVKAIRDGSYALNSAYEASAPIGFRCVFSALGSWTIYPVYLGLILVYFFARFEGWLAVLAPAAKQG